MSTPSMDRQVWLEKSLVYLRQHFADAGFTVPDAVRISIGWPKGSRGKGNSAIGQCWSDKASSDAHSEIFVSPTLIDSVQIMATLCHELAHATVGNEAGHKAPFKRCALAVGLQGKMTATTAAESFVTFARNAMLQIGDYPAGSLTPGSGKKQTTRLLKCECMECGYTARVTRKWIDEVGYPICPGDNAPMTCE